MPTLTEVHDDPRLLLEYIGYDLGTLPEDKEELKELADMRWRNYLMSKREPPLSDKQKYHLFIRECALEEHNIVGRSVAEVRRKCIEKFPHMYCEPDGEFGPPPLCREPDVPPPPRKLR